MLSVFVVLMFFTEARAQQSPFLLPLRWPRSVWGMGMGQQGAAMGGAGEAFPYNPALLAGAEDVSASLFRFPVYSWCCDPIPIHAVTVTSPLPSDIGYAGVEYIRMAYPPFQRRDDANRPLGTVEPTLHSIAIGYARPVATDVHAGAALRYNSWTGDIRDVNFLLFSGGVTWTPAVLDRRLHMGLSLLDLGAALDTPYPTLGDERDAPPAEFRLGLGVNVIESTALTVPFMLDVSKPLEYLENRKALSSFKALFRDWHDFPRDATLHTGIGFEWKRLDLGNDVSFFQRIAIGNYSTGPKAGPFNVFTLSAQAGFAYKGIEAEAGLSAEWQHLPLKSWDLPHAVPREMFAFAVHAPLGLVHGDARPVTPPLQLARVIVSAGPSWTTHLGKYAESDFFTVRDDVLWDLDAALYIDPRNALVASLYYEGLSAEGMPVNGLEVVENTGILRYTAQYRWHPLTALAGLYAQGGGGVARASSELAMSWYNLYSNTDQVCRIEPVFVAAVGLLFPVGDLVIEPQAEFSILLRSWNSNTPLDLAGFDAARFGVRLGYAVK